MNKKIALTVRYHLFREETMDFAEKAGFRYVCMGLGETNVFEHDDWEYQMNVLSEDLARHNLKCIDVHLPVYDLLISGENTDPILDRSMLRCLRAARILGANVCAYHSRSHYIGGTIQNGLDREQSLKDNLKALAPLVEEAEKQDVIIGVENLPPVFYADHTEELITIVDAIHSPNICALWDTGHAHLMDFDHADAIRMLGSRLCATHIHDNIRNYDAHNPPSMGTIDWSHILRAFRDIGYDGYLTLESSYYHGPMSDLYIRYLYDCVSRLYDMMAEF